MELLFPLAGNEAMAPEGMIAAANFAGFEENTFFLVYVMGCNLRLWHLPEMFLDGPDANTTENDLKTAHPVCSSYSRSGKNSSSTLYGGSMRLGG